MNIEEEILTQQEFSNGYNLALCNAVYDEKSKAYFCAFCGNRLWQPELSKMNDSKNGLSFRMICKDNNYLDDLINYTPMQRRCTEWYLNQLKIRKNIKGCGANSRVEWWIKK